MNAEQERATLERARAGDGSAWEALVQLHDRPLFELTFRLLGDRTDAEDVRQLAWLRLWRALPEFEGHARFATFAYRVVVNLCRDRRRDGARRARHERVGLDPTTLALDGLEPPLQLARDESARRVRDALAAMPAVERECLVLRHYHDLAVSEIAAVVGRPRTTVQSCLARALTRLRARLAPAQGAWIGEER